MTLSRPGLYHAYAVSVGVAETGKNGLMTCTIQFSVYEILNDTGEWEPAEGQIVGYFYLERIDGSINTTTVDALKSAFLWDGRDPLWLQDADFSNHAVQIRVVDDEYKGRTRLKVAFVNPYGTVPGGEVAKSHGDKRAALTKRFREKLGIVDRSKSNTKAQSEVPF